MAATDVEIVLGVEGVADVERDMRRADRAVSGASTSISGSLKDMAGGMALAFGGAAIAAVGAFAKESVMAFAEFEQGLADLRSITGATDDQMKFFGESAKTMGLEVEGGANAVSRAFSLIGSAKPELLEDAKALAAVTKEAITLSQASGLELPQAATALTDALNQFKAPAQAAGQYINVLGAAAKFGSAEIPQTTDALLQFGTAAAAASITIEESAAAIQTLAAQGRKGAEAGTDLRAIFGKMASIDALPKNALAQLKKFNVDLNIVKDSSLPLAARLKELGKVSGDATALMEIFGEEHKIAAGILLNSQDTFANLTKQITGTNVATEQATIRTNTLAHSFTQLQNIVGNEMIGVGESLKPVIDALIMDFVPIMTQLKELAASMFLPFKRIGKSFLELAEAFGFAGEGGTGLSGILTVLATTAKVVSIPMRILSMIPIAIARGFTLVVNGISDFIDSSPALKSTIDFLTFPLRALGDSLSWVGEQLGIVDGFDEISDGAKRSFDGLVKELAKVGVSMGATGAQMRAFAEQFKETSIIGLSTADAIKEVDKQFRMFIGNVGKGAVPLEIGKIVKAVGEIGPAFGSIDFLNKRLGDLKKAFTATGSELQRIKLAGQIEDVEFALMRFGNAIDYVKGKDLLGALGVAPVKTSMEQLTDAAVKAHAAVIDVTTMPNAGEGVTRGTFIDGLATGMNEFLDKASEAEKKVNVFTANVKMAFESMAGSIKSYMLDMAADVAFGIGEAIGSGASIGEVFSKALKEMAVSIPKMVGMALLNQAATVPSPASLPLAIAGLALIGASGLLSGIFKAQDAKKEQQSVATDVGTASALPRTQSSGLGAFIDNQQNVGQQVVDALVGQKLTLQVGETTMDAYVGNANRRNNERRGQ